MPFLKSLLKGTDEKLLRDELKDYLNKKFKGKISENISIHHGFAPDYTVENGKKKRIVLLRNPPDIPQYCKQEISICLRNGVGVYIAIDDYEYQIDKFSKICLKTGVGILQYSKHKKKFLMVLPSFIDIPPLEEIDDSLLKVFVSSKLYTEERDIAHKKIKQLRHQPICIERLAPRGNVSNNSIENILSSEYFLGILTPYYSEIIDKEIRTALSKKKNESIIFIRLDSFREGDSKLKKLIDFITLKTTYHNFSDTSNLGSQILKYLPRLIKSGMGQSK